MCSPNLNSKRYHMSISQSDPQNLVILGVADKDLLKRRMEANGRSYARTLIVDPECESVAHFFAGAECIEAVAGAADGPKRMQWFNMPGLRSTRDVAPALKRLFPGLTVTKIAEVQSIQVSTVLGKLGEAEFDLWIDLPGDEADVLAAVLADASSKRIASLKIRTEIEEYFEGSAPQQAVQDTLVSHHFTVGSTGLSDPDWPDLSVEPDALVREVEELRTQLAEAETMAYRINELTESEKALKQKLEATEKRLSEAEKKSSLVDQLVTAKEELQSRNLELGAQIEQLRAEAKRAADLEQKAEALQGQLDGANSAVNVARAATEAKAKELDEAAGQIEDLKKQVYEKANTLDDYKDLVAKNAELTKQLDAEKKAHNAVKTARQNERVAVAEAHEKAARLEQNYRAARQDLSTALQQQTMTQANFADLQQRYNKLADDNRKFAELLGQLQPRLVEAAQQLRSTDKRLDAPKPKRAKPSKKTKV